MSTPAEKIIVPLDVSSEAQAIEWIDRLPQVTFWKVGLELFVSGGPSILTALKSRQKRIFLDLSCTIFPTRWPEPVEPAAAYGVDLLTLHATAGKTALKASQAAAEQGAIAADLAAPNLIAITVLTSLSAQSLAFELKIPLELSDYALQMALLAKESGLAGAVCSPQEVMQLRQICGDDFLLVCPGVRPVWAEAGDQRRSLTPAAALKAGADYLVIGRPITTAPDPAEAFDRICAEMAG
jgi:orotidine-5'-phosphate decarboxylase